MNKPYQCLQTFQPSIVDHNYNGENQGSDNEYSSQ